MSHIPSTVVLGFPACPFIILVISDLGLRRDLILQTDDLSIQNIALGFLILAIGLQFSLARVRINRSCQETLFDSLYVLWIDVCFGVELVRDVSEISYRAQR